MFLIISEIYLFLFRTHVIYFPFGLYLAPYCGYTLSLLVGFVLFLLQVQFCKWWLKGHKHGPLESLWHKWTWMYSKK